MVWILRSIGKVIVVSNEMDKITLFFGRMYVASPLDNLIQKVNPVLENSHGRKLVAVVFVHVRGCSLSKLRAISEASSRLSV